MPARLSLCITVSCRDVVSDSWSLPHLHPWKSVHDCHQWPLLSPLPSTLVACAFSLRSTGHHWQGHVLWRGLGVMCTDTNHSWHCRTGASIVTDVDRSVQTVLNSWACIMTVHCTLVIMYVNQRGLYHVMYNFNYIINTFNWCVVDCTLYPSNYYNYICTPTYLY